MYTLYYSPGSCSLIVHCLLEELRLPFQLRKVDPAAKEAYRKVNPKGKVPALSSPDGTLTESLAIVEYLCDKHDATGRLLGRPGSWQRAKTHEQIATLATELHPLFNRYFHHDDFAAEPGIQDAVKAHGAEKLIAFFEAQDAQLTKPYWSGGDAMNVADLYFMVMARWGRWLTPPANEMKNIRPVYERMVARPAVTRAFAAEGIKPFGTA